MFHVEPSGGTEKCSTWNHPPLISPRNVPRGTIGLPPERRNVPRGTIPAPGSHEMLRGTVWGVHLRKCSTWNHPPPDFSTKCSTWNHRAPAGTEKCSTWNHPCPRLEMFHVERSGSPILRNVPRETVQPSVVPP